MTSVYDAIRKAYHMCLFRLRHIQEHPLTKREEDSLSAMYGSPERALAHLEADPPEEECLSCIMTIRCAAVLGVDLDARVDQTEDLARWAMRNIRWN